MRPFLATALFLALMVGVLLYARRGGGSSRLGPDEEIWTPARVLRLKGPPRACGLQHGERFRGEIQQSLKRHAPKEPGLREFLIQTCGERLWASVPAEMQEEMEGIAEAAGVTSRDILFLHTRYELEQFDSRDRPRRFLGPARAEAGPAVAGFFSRGDFDEEPILLVYESDPPLALLTLPGMVGGFLGLRGKGGAVLRPLAVEQTPVLSGLPWPLLLRALLIAPPSPGLPLGPKPNVPSSVATVLPEGGPGTLQISLAAGTWYPAVDGVAQAGDAPVTGQAGLIDLGSGRVAPPPAIDGALELRLAVEGRRLRLSSNGRVVAEVPFP